jgi:hypothetical protein
MSWGAGWRVTWGGLIVISLASLGNAHQATAAAHQSSALNLRSSLPAPAPVIGPSHPQVGSQLQALGYVARWRRQSLTLQMKLPGETTWTDVDHGRENAYAGNYLLTTPPVRVIGQVTLRVRADNTGEHSRPSTVTTVRKVNAHLSRISTQRRGQFAINAPAAIATTPNNSRIVYGTVRNPDSDQPSAWYLVNRSTGTRTRLHTPMAGVCDISADGAHLLFQEVDRRPSDSSIPQLGILNLTSGAISDVPDPPGWDTGCGVLDSEGGTAAFAVVDQSAPYYKDWTNFLAVWHVGDVQPTIGPIHSDQLLRPEVLGVSADGAVVTFKAEIFTPAGEDGGYRLGIWDRASSTPERLTVSTPTLNLAAAVSSNGKRAAMAENVPSCTFQVADVATGDILRTSTTRFDDKSVDSRVDFPSMSGNGSRAAYILSRNGLVDANLTNVKTGRITSVASSLGSGSMETVLSSMSDDGSSLVLVGSARLTRNDRNDKWDVFVWSAKARQ